ncbi:MAG: ComEC/Rec2 family competence protein [Pseudomonadota bacterium]
MRRGPSAWFAAAVVAELAAQRERWILLLPVAFAGGIAVYHGWPIEPPVAWAWVTTGVALIAAVAAARATGVWRRAVLVLVAAASFGFALAQAQALRLDQPRLQAPRVAFVSGVVELVEPRAEGARLTLRVTAADGLRGPPPERVRVTTRNLDADLHVGDRVRVRARLLPPSEPVMPGAFDFARWAYFKDLGAVGYALGDVERLAAASSAERARWGVAELRFAIARHVVTVVPGDAGGVAAAMLTGLRGDVPEHVWTNMQGAGLAHLLAISGLHLGLVAGTVFVVVRYGICLLPWLAVRVQAHRVAAVVGLLAATLYLVLAGATVPTQRAFLMIAVVLVAMLLDREAISLRLVAFAAVVVLAIDPAALYGASFQMSFAAVTSLVAVYERWRWRPVDREAGAPGLLLTYVLGVAVTTVIATLATAPFAAFHFGRLPAHGIVANLVAVPLMAFWIMPLAFLALLLMPLGLDAPILGLAAAGIDLVLATAAATSGWPGAFFDVAHPPGGAIALLTVAGLWAVLWRGRLARAAIVPALAAVLWILGSRPPDLVVDRAGSMAAMRQADGGYALVVERRSGFVLRGWRRALGIEAFAEPGGSTGVRCDDRGCRLVGAGGTVALALRPNALLRDCIEADLVVNVATDVPCSATPTITRGELWSRGGLALRLDDLAPRFVLPADTRRLWQRDASRRP